MWYFKLFSKNPFTLFKFVTQLHTGLEPYENINIFKVVLVLIVNITFNVVYGQISTFIAL